MKPQTKSKSVKSSLKSANAEDKETRPKVPTLQKMVSKNPNFEFLNNGKIKCILTGHEIEPTRQNFQSYLKSKSYKKGVESKFDISQFQEILIDHKDNPKMFLYCQLTGSKIPKKKSAIQKHLKGRKFQRRFQQVQQEGQGSENGEQFDNNQQSEEEMQND